jgi:DNA polymerase V
MFGVSEDFTEDFQSLDEHFIKNRSSTFFFKAMGSTMAPTINHDDILIVDRSINYAHNKVCIVSYNGELLCKRVLYQNNHLLLRSDNSRVRDITVTESLDTLLWGVVIAKCSQVH